MTPRLIPITVLLIGLAGCSQHVVRGPAGKTAVASVMRRQAANAVDAGDGNYQIRVLRQRMTAEPDNLKVRLELARLYEQAGFPEVAVEHYRLAAARFPDHAGIQLLLLKALRAQGLAAEAAESLAAFLEKPAHRTTDLYSWLGILCDELGRLPEAERAHRAALALAPNRDAAHNNLGYNLLLQGKNAEAAAEFRRALALQPHSQIARNNLGLALAAEPKQAVLHWQSISDPATAHNNLAAVLIEQGRYEEARRELDVALGYNRDHRAALSNLKLVSQLDGRPASFTLKPVEPWWKRLARAIGKALEGVEPPQNGSGAVRTASR